MPLIIKIFLEFLNSVKDPIVFLLPPLSTDCQVIVQVHQMDLLGRVDCRNGADRFSTDIFSLGAYQYK